MLFVCVLVILICKLDLALLNTRYTKLVTVELYQEEMVAFDKVSCCLLVDFHLVIAMRHNGPISVTFQKGNTAGI